MFLGVGNDYYVGEPENNGHRTPDNGRPADAVFGQSDFGQNGENRWKLAGRDTLCWPYGISAVDGVLAVADSGNNRVLLWDGEEPGDE